MELHQVDYTVLRTGSRLFDGVIIEAANQICAALPGIRCEVTPTEIHILGALNDADFAEYERFMFGDRDDPELKEDQTTPPDAQEAAEGPVASTDVPAQEKISAASTDVPAQKEIPQSERGSSR